MWNHEDVVSFIETQLEVWPMAKSNYDALQNVKRRNINVHGFDIGIQFNPARIVSTGAKIDPLSINQRPCFLCKANRPKEQLGGEILDGWEILVNPYPILPVHLTIVATDHRPQDMVPHDIIPLAEQLPGMAVFFNGAHAGASAPDHLHLQAVLKDELPLLRLIEHIHPSDRHGLLKSSDLISDFPYMFFSGVVAPDPSGMPTLAAGLRLGGLNPQGRLIDPTLVNSFFWIDPTGKLRFAIVPRRAHRPSCYQAEDDKNRMISPGCIDMAGLIITPRERDYEDLTVNEIEKIFAEVALSHEF